MFKVRINEKWSKFGLTISGKFASEFYDHFSVSVANYDRTHLTERIYNRTFDLQYYKHIEYNKNLWINDWKIISNVNTGERKKAEIACNFLLVVFQHSIWYEYRCFSYLFTSKICNFYGAFWFMKQQWLLYIIINKETSLHCSRPQNELIYWYIGMGRKHSALI